MKILGIDPGTATVGWAVIYAEEGNIRTAGHGCIETSKHLPDSERLLEIAKDLKKIIKKHSPSEAAIEEIFFFKNQKTVIKVSEARGVLLLTLKENGVKISEYTPLEVKQAITGYGRAEKKQVQLMVKQILNLKDTPKPDDAADALAIAICHLNSRKIKQLS